MKRFLTAALLVLSLAGPALAAPGVRVEDAWVRTPPPGARTAAAYVTMTNPTRVPDLLLGAATPAAARVGLHSMSMAGGIMRMREVAAIEVPPGATVALRPGDGRHLMLTGLRRPLRRGDRFPAILRFQHGGPVSVTLAVRDAPAPTRMGAMPGMGR